MKKQTKAFLIVMCTFMMTLMVGGLKASVKAATYPENLDSRKHDDEFSSPITKSP